MKAILTRYHGPSNVKGARISATAGKNRVFISYPHELSGDEPHRMAAYALRDKMNWKGELIGGGFENGDMAWVFAP